jgi:hypothetical protein
VHERRRYQTQRQSTWHSFKRIAIGVAVDINRPGAVSDLIQAGASRLRRISRISSILPHRSQQYWTKSLPCASGKLFAIFIVTLQTMQVRRSISGLLSSFALFISFRLRNQFERPLGEPQSQLTAAVTSNPRPQCLGPRQRQSDFPAVLFTPAFDPTIIKQSI